MAEIREELPGDEAGIREVEQAAFGREAEAMLVDEVRDLGAALLSLVAVEAGDQVIGHVLFTPATIGASTPAALLGPLAVHPDHQGKGIGGALIREGLRRIALRGYGSVILVGDPRYYRRFGFQPGSTYGVRWEKGRDEAFMAIELKPSALAGGGVARLLAAFSRV
ncbi:MAG: N-acetyltransferase [Alphaproteobacteria bacterium]|nr:N-acetyltransferase [Alphaproteobacteria bacterium]